MFNHFCYNDIYILYTGAIIFVVIPSVLGINQHSGIFVVNIGKDSFFSPFVVGFVFNYCCKFINDLL
jgi:hypothetical protein